MTGTSPETRWQAALCTTCPVPGIAKANACEHQQLSARVERRLLGFKRTVVVKAYCQKSVCDVDDPHIGCGQCHPNIPLFIVGE